MSKPIPIPHALWGGPGELYVLKDASIGREVHLRINAHGNLVLATDEAVYVFDVRDCLGLVTAINNHLSSGRVDLAGQQGEGL